MSELPWQAVQRALDARRDPLEEPEVAEHLVAEPEALEPLLALLDRLRCVAELAASTRRADGGGVAAGAGGAARVGSVGVSTASARPGPARPRPTRPLQLVALAGLLAAAASLAVLVWRGPAVPDARRAPSDAPHVPTAGQSAASGGAGAVPGLAAAPPPAPPLPPQRPAGRVHEWSLAVHRRGPGGSSSQRTEARGPSANLRTDLRAAPTSDIPLLAWSHACTRTTPSRVR